MLESLIWLTAAVCLIALLWARRVFRDVFHPIVLTVPMFAFFYVYMPWRLVQDGYLFSYLSESQCIFAHSIILGGMTAFILGCFHGSRPSPKQSSRPAYVYHDYRVLQRGGYLLGAVGLAAWLFTVQGAGGITDVFSRPKGMGWSDYGYVREASYLMIAGLLLLLSPQGCEPKSWRWRVAVASFALPYLIQGLLGAQRGPTFLVCTALGMSWYLARHNRPSPTALAGAGVSLGFLMLFLVVNRGALYLGTQEPLKTDVSEFFQPSEANEYIFGAGCIVAAHRGGSFFWGRRYLAQLLVRPIPRQIWPTKYVDFGVPEIEQNAGVAGAGLEAVLGWREVPGAAATAIPDGWVEFSWMSFPFFAILGWCFGYTWRRAISQGQEWISLFTVCCLLSFYYISQGVEAVLFRFLILSLPLIWVWRRTRYLERSRA